MRPRAAPLLILPLVTLHVMLGGGCPAEAAPEEALRPPAGRELALDGRPDEAAWEGAARMAVPPVDVPTPDGPKALAPDVRLLSAQGRLVIGVACAEDPGTSLGLHVMCAPEGTKSAADAVSIDFRPVEPRAPRYRAAGPQGVGRTHYRVEGAADVTRPGAWSLELAVPWADLAPRGDETLRLAVVVYTRTPNVTSAWPAGAAWHGPAAWREVVPPEGGWPREAQVDAARLAAEDAADVEHAAAWLAFQKGASTPILPTLPRAEVVARFEQGVVEPLRAVLRARPDLAAPVHCLLGDCTFRLGFWTQAQMEYEAAVRAAPGWREAQYGLHVQVRGQGAAEGTPGAASDYVRAFAALDRMAAEEGASAWVREGARLGRALLEYKHGAFDAAVPVLAELARRYPFDPFLDTHARFAEAGRRAASEEALRAAREPQRARPQADVETTRGTFVIELFPEDAPNTVRNFVYLARKGFYDGVAFHRTVPFFLAQTGDPNSKAGAAAPGEVGAGGPGYAIRSERNDRRMLRGAVVMASAGPDSEGSQFYVLTGTAMHLQGEQAVFGRIARGQEVVDALTTDDRIVTVALRDLDPAERYVPITVAGREP